jgi:hypothetical protein
VFSEWIISSEKVNIFPREPENFEDLPSKLLQDT